MDWSSVFEETGEESGQWERHEVSSRLEPFIDKFYYEGSYDKNACYAFTINYVLGVGALGIPYAYNAAGIILATLVVILLTFVTFITVMWVAEASHRGLQVQEELDQTLKKNGSQMRSRNKRLKSPLKDGALASSIRSSPLEYSTIKELLDGNIEREMGRERAGTLQSTSADSNVGVENNDESDRNNGLQLSAEPEVAELTLIFLGPTGRMAYQGALLMLTFVGLLAYAQVFQQAFTSQILPTAPVLIPVIIFGTIVIPLSCFDLSEQVTVQLIMFIMRFIILFLLISGTIFGIYTSPSTAISGIPNSADGPFIVANVPLANYNGFGAIFTTAIFSQLFQHSVPNLIRPLSQEDKTEVPLIFAKALGTTGSIYIILGIVTTLYFGSNIKESINLNFSGFSWGLSGNERYTALIVSTLITIFPALDTLSVFPLIANTLGNNLHACFPESRSLVQNFLGVDVSSKKLQRITTIIWRLIAAIPPVFLSAFVTDLTVSLQLAGICGIIVALIIPALLQRYSLLRIINLKDNNRLGLSSSFLINENPYSTQFSSTFYVNGVLMISFITFAICLCQFFALV